LNEITPLLGAICQAPPPAQPRLGSCWAPLQLQMMGRHFSGQWGRGALRVWRLGQDAAGNRVVNLGTWFICLRCLGKAWLVKGQRQPQNIALWSSMTMQPASCLLAAMSTKYSIWAIFNACQRMAGWHRSCRSSSDPADLEHCACHDLFLTGRH
jgi:hypothetical protein